MGPRIRRGYTQGYGTQTDRAGCTPAPMVTIGNKTTEDLGVHEYRNWVFLIPVFFITFCVYNNIHS